jgi:hypothetical protein
VLPGLMSEKNVNERGLMSPGIERRGIGLLVLAFPKPLTL